MRCVRNVLSQSAIRPPMQAFAAVTRELPRALPAILPDLIALLERLPPSSGHPCIACPPFPHSVHVPEGAVSPATGLPAGRLPPGPAHAAWGEVGAAEAALGRALVAPWASEVVPLGTLAEAAAVPIIEVRLRDSRWRATK